MRSSARDAEQRCGDRQKQLRRSYSLYEAEFLDQRRRLEEAVAKGEPASRHKLKTCEQELESLDARRSAAESSLLMELDSLRMGPVTLFATALVLPLPPGQADRRRDDQVELTAVRVAREHEERHGAYVEDVSDPTKKMGFDLCSHRMNGTV